MKTFLTLSICVQDVEANTVQSTETSEESQIDEWSALFWLAVLTILISILSEYLVDAIQVLCET
jgi:Ca2+/H+ antiporter